MLRIMLAPIPLIGRGWCRALAACRRLQAGTTASDGWLTRYPSGTRDQIVQVAEEGDGLSQFCKLNRALGQIW